MLHTAPEVLREALVSGSQAGDIYSFAIVCSELVGHCSAWNLENRKEEADGQCFNKDQSENNLFQKSFLWSSGVVELLSDPV